MNLIYIVILNLDSSNYLGNSLIFIFHFYRKGGGVFFPRRKATNSKLLTVYIHGAKLLCTIHRLFQSPPKQNWNMTKQVLEL